MIEENNPTSSSTSEASPDAFNTSSAAPEVPKVSPEEAWARFIRASSCVGAALLLGVLGDGLFWNAGLGLNASLWVSLVLVALWVLSVVLRLPLLGEGRWWLLVGALFAWCLTWRDSSALRMLNVLAVLLALGLACAATRQGRLMTARVNALLLAWWQAGLSATADMPGLVFMDVPWASLPRPRSSGEAKGVLRGLLLALPVLVVFGALFASADAVFGRLFKSLTSVQFNADNVIGHVILIGFLAWVVGGFLRRALRPQRVLESRVRGLTLPQTEMMTVLGLVVALFAVFVLVQIGYLFGGINQLEVTGLTYSEYARRGFFELVWVASLTLPLLLVLHSLIPEGQAQQERIFTGLALTLIALLAVVMLSAVQRMRLYVLEYGLTELRLYPTAFMLWLAVVFAWFVWTLVRRDRDRFAFGMVSSAVVMLVVLNAVNPDALIVRYNASRATQNNQVLPESGAGILEGRRRAVESTLDVDYALRLSADAVPVLLEVLASRASGGGTGDARQRLLMRWGQPQEDWRAWNGARAQATVAVRREQAK